MIAFLCVKSDKSTMLQLTTIGGDSIHAVDTPDGLPRIGDPAFTSDGKRLCFWAAPAKGPDGGVLFTVPVAGGSPKPLLEDAVDDARYMDPVFSPDSKYVAFVQRPASGSAGHARIMRADADGSNIVPLTDTKFDRTDPTWSTDSSQLAYTSDEPSDDWPGTDTDRIWRMNVDGDQQKVLWTHHAADAQAAAAWTPR